MMDVCMCLEECYKKHRISCFKGRVKECETICGVTATNGNYCVRGYLSIEFQDLVLSVWQLHFKDLYMEVQVIVKQQTENINRKSHLLNHGSCWWATNLLVHFWQRQLVHKGQLLQHRPNPVLLLLVESSFTLEIIQHDTYFPTFILDTRNSGEFITTSILHCFLLYWDPVAMFVFSNPPDRLQIFTLIK